MVHGWCKPRRALQLLPRELSPDPIKAPLSGRFDPVKQSQQVVHIKLQASLHRTLRGSGAIEHKRKLTKRLRCPAPESS
jgi:hypothetical protein